MVPLIEEGEGNVGILGKQWELWVEISRGENTKALKTVIDG